jgi:hypothetical protein
MAETTYSVRKVTLNSIAHHAVMLEYPLNKLGRMNERFTDEAVIMASYCNNLRGKIKKLHGEGRLKESEFSEFDKDISSLLDKIEKVRGFVHTDYYRARDIVLEHQGKLLGHVERIEDYDISGAIGKARKDVDSLVHANLRDGKDVSEGSFISGERLI